MIRPSALFLSALTLAIASIGLAAPAQAQSAEELAKANNPLASMTAFNLQNYYVPTLYGIPDRKANTFWFRYAKPILNGKVLVRASLPLSTVPTGALDPKSGVGDFNIIGFYLAVSKPTSTFGIGPILAAPTASEDALGTGKWQAGAAMVAFKVLSPQIQLGGLLTGQWSVGGDDDRADTGILVLQPFMFVQLGGGTYLRSAPLWFYNLETDDYNIPFGFGIGKVVKVGNVVYNIFLEPQFTVLHEGVGQPALQVFSGLNLQFAN